jgi:hypothetical protein
MSKRLPAHADGTATIAGAPTVPPAPVKDHGHDAEELTADEQARERQIDRLDQEFHKHACDLAGALAFADSPACHGRQQEAFGKCVTLARRMIASDEKLRDLGAAHERES